MQLAGTATTLDIAGEFLMNTLVLPLQKTQLWHCRNDMPHGPECLLFLFQKVLL